MTEPQYAVRHDPDGRFTVVDQSDPLHVYPLACHRYATREEAQEKVDRYNGIMEGRL